MATCKTIGNGSMPLRIGNLINAPVFGGPYKEHRYYPHMFGVKMAEEIDRPCDVDIPTKDYHVPKVSDLRAGVIMALMAMITGKTVYAGCMGGIGRTGIFLAALAKVQIEYRKRKHRKGRGDDPVEYVRKHFIPNALETDEQVKYIADFDVIEIVVWLETTQAALGLSGVTPARPIDADCVSLPNGDCVAEGPCMHGPAVQTRRASPEQELKRAVDYATSFATADSRQTFPVKLNPCRDGPDCKFCPPADSRLDNHKATWKERYKEVTTQAYESFQTDEFADFDSANPEDLQTQILKLDEKIERYWDHTESNLASFATWTRLSLKEYSKPLTKQTWREKIVGWLESH